MYKEDRDAFEEEIREIDESDMEEFSTIDSSEKSTGILGDRWWSQAAKQQGDKISKTILCVTWKQRNERPTVGGVFIWSRNGASSRKECRDQWSNK